MIAWQRINRRHGIIERLSLRDGIRNEVRQSSPASPVSRTTFPDIYLYPHPSYHTVIAQIRVLQVVGQPDSGRGNLLALYY